ncbi:MAG: hypothetical protein ABSC56_09440 [Solirubrobacteraceae bacterium]|jgi:hypothetical protein
MIVRIFTEGQYRLDDSERETFERLDEALHQTIDGHDEQAFEKALAELMDYVRSHGTVLADADLEPSDLMLPPPDTSFKEAKVKFTGEGLIPD